MELLTLRGIPVPEKPWKGFNFVNTSHGVKPHFKKGAMREHRDKIYKLLQIYRLVGVLTHKERYDFEGASHLIFRQQQQRQAENAPDNDKQNVSETSRKCRSSCLMSDRYSARGKFGVMIMVVHFFPGGPFA